MTLVARVYLYCLQLFITLALVWGPRLQTLHLALAKLAVDTTRRGEWDRNSRGHFHFQCLSHWWACHTPLTPLMPLRSDECSWVVSGVVLWFPDHIFLTFAMFLFIDPHNHSASLPCILPPPFSWVVAVCEAISTRESSRQAVKQSIKPWEKGSRVALLP